MKSVERLVYDCTNLVAFFIDAKRADNKIDLEGIKSQVETRITQYDQLIETPETSTTSGWSDGQKRALHHCYKVETKPLTNIKTAVFGWWVRKAVKDPGEARVS